MTYSAEDQLLSPQPRFETETIGSPRSLTVGQRGANSLADDDPAITLESVKCNAF